MVCQVQILICKNPYLENQLNLLLEAIIVLAAISCIVICMIITRKSYLVEKNSAIIIIIQFHFLTFNAVSERISWYKKTQPWDKPCSFKKGWSPQPSVLFASPLAQAARLTCRGFGQAASRCAHCIQKQNREKHCAWLTPGKNVGDL